MSKARTIRIPGPIWEAFEALFQKEDGPFSGFETINAAAAGLFVWATTFNQRPHNLSAGIAKLRGNQRDLIYEFIHFAAVRGIYLGDFLPKPATAESLLALAKSLKTPGGFKEPTEPT